MAEIAAATLQWREDFDRRFSDQSARTSESLDKITKLIEQQNNRVRANEMSIMTKADEGRVRKVELTVEGLKTWVALIGGATGLIGIAAALLQALK